MPIAGITGGEGPFDGGPVDSILNVGIVEEVRGVVEIHETVSADGKIKSDDDYDQQ